MYNQIVCTRLGLLAITWGPQSIWNDPGYGMFNSIATIDASLGPTTKQPDPTMSLTIVWKKKTLLNATKQGQIRNHCCLWFLTKTGKNLVYSL